MEQGKMRLGFVLSIDRSPPLEDVLVYLYTNQITILPLAGDDNGMDKKNKTSSGYCHSTQLTISPTVPYVFHFGQWQQS